MAVLVIGGPHAPREKNSYRETIPEAQFPKMVLFKSFRPRSVVILGSSVFLGGVWGIGGVGNRRPPRVEEKKFL